MWWLFQTEWRMRPLPSLLYYLWPYCLGQGEDDVIVFLASSNDSGLGCWTPIPDTDSFPSTSSLVFFSGALHCSHTLTNHHCWAFILFFPCQKILGSKDNGFKSGLLSYFSKDEWPIRALQNHPPIIPSVSRRPIKGRVKWVENGLDLSALMALMVHLGPIILPWFNCSLRMKLPNLGRSNDPSFQEEL